MGNIALLGDNICGHTFEYASGCRCDSGSETGWKLKDKRHITLNPYMPIDWCIRILLEKRNQMVYNINSDLEGVPHDNIRID